MVAKAKRLYEAQHPETKRGGDSRVVIENRAPSFVAYCAEVMGRSVRAVSVDVTIGKGLSQASYILLKDTPAADAQNVLLDLARLDGAYMIAKEGASNVTKAMDMAAKAASDLEVQK